jgi:hypothetical protein
VALRTLEYPGFSLRVPDDWGDITADLDADSPITLARPSGVGVLQLSCARYVSAALPSPTCDDLDEMLMDFAAAHELGVPRERIREEEPLLLAAATFDQGDASVRAWYVSDGRSVAKVTYMCLGSELKLDEVRDCESIVRNHRVEVVRARPTRESQHWYAKLSPKHLFKRDLLNRGFGDGGVQVREGDTRRPSARASPPRTYRASSVRSPRGGHQGASSPSTRRKAKRRSALYQSS